eukprot:6194712-Pleurochrysis_carterae.AAC.3
MWLRKRASPFPPPTCPYGTSSLSVAARSLGHALISMQTRMATLQAVLWIRATSMQGWPTAAPPA